MMSLPALDPSWLTVIDPAEMLPSVIAPFTRLVLPPPSLTVILTRPVPASISAPWLMVKTLGWGLRLKPVRKSFAISRISPLADAIVPSSRIDRPALKKIESPPSRPRSMPSPVRVIVPLACANRLLVSEAAPALPMMPLPEVMKLRSPEVEKRASCTRSAAPRAITSDTPSLFDAVKTALRALRTPALTSPDRSSIENCPDWLKPPPLFSELRSICPALMTAGLSSSMARRLKPPLVCPEKSKRVVKIGLPWASTPVCTCRMPSELSAVLS